MESGATISTEAAGGAAVNPDKASVSVTGSTLTVNGTLTNSGYGGYSYCEAVATAIASQNSLALVGTIKVSADADSLYGACGGYAYAGLADIPVGTSGTLTANASNNKITDTGSGSTFWFVTDFSKVTIKEVEKYRDGTISPEAGLELRSALMGGYAETLVASTAGTAESRNAQSIDASAVADNNTVTFSTLNLQPEVNVTGQDGSQGQAIEYRSMVTAGGGQAVAVSTAKGDYVDYSGKNVASSDENTFTVGTLNLEEKVSSVRAELEQTTTLSGGDALARYESPSFMEKRTSDQKVSIITESYQQTKYSDIINMATADNNTATIDSIVIGGKLNTDDKGGTATDIEAEGELETRAGHAEAIVFLNDTNSTLDGLVNNAQANGNTLTIKKVVQNIEQKSTQDKSGAVTQASTMTMLLHGGNSRNEITQNGTEHVTWENVKASAAANHNTITLEAISSNVTESSLTGGAATSDILPMEGTGTMKTTIVSNTASATGNTAQMGLNTPVQMGLGCVASGGVADVSVAAQNNFNNNAGTDNGLTLAVGTMGADASSNTIKVVGTIDSSGNNNSAATTTALNSGADFLASAGITNAVNAAVMEAFGNVGGASAGGTASTGGTASAAGDTSSDSDGNGESGSGSVGEARAVRGGSFAPFAALGGSSMRAKSGSYVDTRGWGLNVGFARALKNKNGVMTFGPIVEYGRGNYTSRLDDGTLGFGDTQFFGVGVFLRQNNTDGLWYEGSLRAGRMKSDYRGNLNNNHVTYDTESNYYAAHLGLGKVNKVSAKGSLDIYTKVFYAHQASSDADLSTGEHFDFGSVNSLRWRVGGKYSHRVSETGSLYAGLAYEYEFKGDATATYQGMSTPSPSVKGGSGLLELGYTMKPGAKSPVTLDFGVNLWTGKKEGIGGALSVSWAL